MKGKITSEYVRRVKKLCVDPNLMAGIFLVASDAWVVGVVRYSAGIVDWTVEELVSMNRKTRKILVMNGCLHTRMSLDCNC